MLKLLASKCMYNFQPHISYVATLPEKILATKMNASVCCFPPKSVGGSEKRRLDHDGNLQRSIENVQNYGQLWP